MELLVAAGRADGYQIRQTLAEIAKELETSGATRLLTAIDICNTRLAAAIVGIFGLYESRLQSLYGWEKPLREVHALLLRSNAAELAEKFDNVKLAVNVLKHGTGDSQAILLPRAESLPFRVAARFGDFHEEGECCPPLDLVLVSAELLELCCDVIEASSAIVEDAMRG